MSFAGHVFDMIRRNKEYHDMRNLRHERTNDIRKRCMKNGISLQDSHVTLEEIEQITKQLKEHKAEEQKNAFQTKLITFGSIAIVTLLLLMLLKWLIF